MRVTASLLVIVTYPFVSVGELLFTNISTGLCFTTRAPTAVTTSKTTPLPADGLAVNDLDESAVRLAASL